MRRVHDEPDDAGEGYFASISDLMVGILFIFLLMLTVFAINYANEDKDLRIAQLEKQLEERTRERDKLHNGISRLLKEVEGLRVSLRGEQGRLENIRRELLFTLQASLENRGVKVEVDPGQGILRLSSDGLFELNEARFTARGEENARALLEEMAQLLPCFAKQSSGSTRCARSQPIFETVLIEGHTDTRPTQRQGGNWTLSTDRARAFMELMGGITISVRELRNPDNQPLLGLAGYGDSRPRPGMPGADERNRRIETRFLLAGQHQSLAEQLRGLDEIFSDLKDLVAAQP